MKIFQIITFLLLSICFINCSESEKQHLKKPTVYTVGDSTVKNGKGNGDGGLWGWGDFIGQFLDTTKVSIKNHALGGTSSRTYQNLGLWDSVQKKLHKGDYVLIQFGHNDNGPVNDTIRARGTIKGIGNESEEINNMLTHEHEIVHSYGWYINKIVKESKAKGAIPVIMSPIPRNKWEDGKIPRNNESYGLWAKQIAEKENVTFIDLNDKLAEKLEGFGELKVTGTYFYKRDHTHTSAKGAALAASSIIEGLKQTDNSLKDYVLKNPKITFPKKKNIYLIGDSTMANNNNDMVVGWGIPFPKFVDTMRVNVINKARGGRSTRTFINEGLWDKALAEFKAGDYVFIQFGHNDAGNIDKKKYRGSLPDMGNETQEVNRDSVTETVHTFGWNMIKMIQDTKAKGAIPIVLSLTPRNEWPNGKVERRSETYITWSEQAAKAEDVAYIDLSEAIALKYEALGKEHVKTFFPQDHTHTGKEGATFNALVLAEILKKSKSIGLRDYIELPIQK
ncbi:rhamnogalacturonan acetylesterase [Formosa sp. 4Alg 33]|uniref:rhamnogalacturonan acetylesterase n=1 Tax=Formosa sp. 4Alg 33 TaxID=3382189 RepID=UPI003D9C1CF6